MLSKIHNCQKLRGEEFEGEGERVTNKRVFFFQEGRGGYRSFHICSSSTIDDETTERKRSKRNICAGKNSATPFLTLVSERETAPPMCGF